MLLCVSCPICLMSLSECCGNLELVFLLTSENDTPSELRISVAEVLRDARPIHLGHKCLFPLAPEQQPDHVLYFVHLNEKGCVSLLGGSSVGCHMFHCCFPPFAMRGALASQMKSCAGRREVCGWTEMPLQWADVSKKSTFVINHKDYEIIFCLCVFNRS